MPRLTEAEKGRVAVAFVKARIRKEGLHLRDPSDFKTDTHNKAREMGVKPALALQFMHEIVVDWLKEVFPEDPFLQN